MNLGVLIIVGGIQGCATAYHLAKQSVSVIVLEKDNEARHASGVNAGGCDCLAVTSLKGLSAMRHPW